MGIGKLVTLAAMVAAAVGITAGTVNAAPTADNAPAVHGVDHGIGYEVAMQKDNIISTKIADGAFTVAADGRTVSLHDAAGAVVSEFPIAGQVHNQPVAMTAALADNGRALTLTPTSQPTSISAKNIDGSGWFTAELQRAAPGALVGGIIGAFIGVFLFGIGIIPGALVGAVAGLLISGGQPLIDSGFAYFRGE